MKKRLKINGIIMFCTFWVVAAFPNIFFRSAKFNSFNTIARIFGITFILLGQILRASSRGFKSEYSGDGYALLQDGPYALVRNPMYLGILLIGLGIVAMLFKWWVAGIFLLTFIARYLILVFKEEKKLMGLFGQTYRDYCKEVPRILPSLRMLAKVDIAEYLPLKLSWLRKEIGTILAVLLLAVFWESWEDIKNTGFRIYFKEIIAIMSTIMLFIILAIYLSRKTGSLKQRCGK